MLYYSQSVNPGLSNNVPVEEGDVVEQTYFCSGTIAGNKYTVKYHGGQESNPRIESCGCHHQWKLISKTNKRSFMISIKQAFKDLLTTEPKKSLKKAGIIQESGDFTMEGREVFLEWLFNRKEISESFMKEVVTPILDEEKKNKA